MIRKKSKSMACEYHLIGLEREPTLIGSWSNMIGVKHLTFHLSLTLQVHGHEVSYGKHLH